MNRKDQMLRTAKWMVGVVFAGTSICAAAPETTPADQPPPAAPPVQTRPAAAPAGGNWWDNAAPPRPAVQPPMRDRDDDRGNPFRRDDRMAAANSSAASDYPASELGSWVMANTMAARARMLFSRAQSELSATIRHVQARYEKSRDYQEALSAERQAYGEYIETRKQALRSLADDEKYKAIIRLRDELGEKLAHRRLEKDASKDEILAMATLKMNYASDARALEVAALNADPTLKSVHDRMVAASQRVSQLRAQMDDALRDAPEVLAARNNLENARIAMVEASAYAYASAVAGSTALNYSYFLHRNDATYGPGYTYGSPYWGR
jgi:hypothetical protein